jgi:hypothetical protein
MKAALTVLIAAALAATPAFAAPSTPKETTMTTQQNQFPHDFDFLVGKWRVHHWRLKERLAGSTEWQEFYGTSELHLTMNGQGTFDENFLDLPGDPYRAVGIRAYDPKTKTWAIWWIDGRNPHAPVDPPTIGTFKDGVGTFLADDTLRGKPIKVRYEWSRITANTAHWEQAFSPDGGKNWEVNWRMDFERISK